MTTCVAALCEDSKAIILVSDKMLGMTFIESEPDICKAFQIHRDWWLLIAGDGIETIEPIKNATIENMKPFPDGATLVDAIKATETAYESKRSHDAEILYLRKRGWTFEQLYQHGKNLLPEQTLNDWYHEFWSHDLMGVQILIAGFDPNGVGHIFSLESQDPKTCGIAQQHDIAGHYAIGSGALDALFIMAYREYAPNEKLRQALYLAFEGKYYGENAPGVGIRTDIYILRAGNEKITISEKIIDDQLANICRTLEPNKLTARHYGILNNLTELKDLPIMELPDRLKKGASQTAAAPSSSIDSPSTRST